MNYIKVSIQITPFADWLRDILASELADTGFESFAETDSGIEAFVPENLFDEAVVKETLKPYKGEFSFTVSNEIIKSKNWNAEWEKNYFKPLLVNDECLIRAPFHTEYPKARYEIIIEPNMAFGTGNHETTSMMIEHILENDMTGKKVMDMGCGTGILGILASMKGAKKVTAIDIDEWSYNGTMENAQLNKIENIEVKLGDSSLLGNEKYDFIFANIQRNVLLADIPVYSKCLHKNGKIFLSGYYENDMNVIKTAAENNGLKDAGFKMKNNWVAHSFLLV